MKNSKSKNNGADPIAPKHKIVTDEEYSVWTKPRPWALFLLLAMEIVNFIYGPQFWYELGLQYKMRGWTEASRFFCRMSNFANPWSRTGKMAEAFSRVCLPHNNVPEKAQLQNIEAYNLDMCGQTSKAIVIYQQVIKEQPNFEWPYNNLANIEIDKKNFIEAEQLCIKALYINPDYANAHYTLGRALWGQQRIEEANEHFAKAKSFYGLNNN